MLNLRFRTRLALVMFLTMACTTVALMVTYVRHDRQEKAYTTVLTSDLLQIVNVAQQHIPQNSDRKQALEFYSKALKDAGLSTYRGSALRRSGGQFQPRAGRQEDPSEKAPSGQRGKTHSNLRRTAAMWKLIPGWNQNPHHRIPYRAGRKGVGVCADQG